MSGPYAPGSYGPPAPKRLTRSREDKFLGGVCGGVARYLNMDPTLVRVLWAVLSLVTSGAGVLVYLVMLFVVPEDSANPPQVQGQPHPGAGAPQGDPVWGRDGAPWEQRRPSGQPGPSARPSAQAPVTPPASDETPRTGDDPVS